MSIADWLPVWKTSARLLYESRGQVGDPTLRLLIADLYNKARSYAIINKIAFWFAVAGGVLVLVWPALPVILEDCTVKCNFLKSPIVQTSVTGLAALVFAVYSHYKKRQVSAENLMRHVIYSKDPPAELAVRIVGEMEKIDAGFKFDEAVGRGSKKEADKKEQAGP